MRRTPLEKSIIDREVVGEVFRVFDKMKQLGFEERDGQFDMALDIAEAIKDGDNLIVEAGVGIGKTFAYLFPSMLYTSYFGKPVVIASSTIHLTEQLEKDIIDAEKISNLTVSSIVGKGQRNYFCENRARKYKAVSKKDPIKKYIDDYPHSKITLSNNDWEKINVNNCTFNQCDYRFDCEFYNMREGLKGYGKMAGDIIIVNQDLLIVNYLKEEKTGHSLINGNHDVVIIDEAHNLEEKARNALTISFNKNDINNVINQAERVTRESYSKLKYMINDLYIEIKKFVESNLPDEVENSRSAFHGDYLSQYIDLVRLIRTVYDKVQIVDIQSDKASDELIETLDDLVTLIEGIFDPTLTNNIYWAELSSNKVTLSYAPDNIAEKLNQLFFTQSKQFILTSATISAGYENREYKYLRESIGLHKTITSKSKPSPFPYDKNARLYLPDQISEYEDANFVHELSDYILKLATATNGRTLVLFTSKNEMEEVYRLIKESKNHHFNIIRQSNRSEKETLEEFRETKGILLATGTYWEGLNIEGSDLTSLIITRLPFPVPDPVIENKMKKSPSPYQDVLFPEMILKLRQGVGRLIRTATDVGVLSILDSRLAKNSTYRNKDKILKSIPIRNQVDSIEEISSFLEEI